MLDIFKKLGAALGCISIVFAAFFWLNEHHAKADEFHAFVASVQYDRDQQRYFFLDKWLSQIDDKYGYECATCPAELKEEYRQKRAEWRLLERKLTEK